MIITITNKTTIKDVQRKINIAYPFIKIEFSDKPHRKGEPTKNAHWYDPSFKLLDMGKNKEPGWLVLQPWHKTGFVEDLFENRFGLHAQIFRKENNQWMQTAGTDVFTLEEQNEIGRRLIDTTHAPYRRERELLL